MSLLILLEAELQLNLRKLADAWTSEGTFLLVPDKVSSGMRWIEHSLEQLPAALKTGHFGLLTSGSTGQPKLVLGEKVRAESLSKLLNEIQLGGPVSQTLLTLPLSYCYAFVNQWLWARVHHRQLIQTPGFSQPDLLHQELEGSENAMLCMVGAQIPLLKRFMPTARYPGIIRLHFAGGIFPQEHLEFLLNMFPNAKVFNNYGCAEAMPRLAIRSILDSEKASNIGFPLPGVEFLLDTDGVLKFRSQFGAKAFVENEQLFTIDETSWISTGDLAQQSANGSWELLGRANEVFKRYGEKISIPQLLSSVRQSWNGQAAMYSETDSAGEHGCVLLLSPEPGKTELRAILQTLRANHGRPHWPIRIESTSNFPVLSNGKIDQHSLPKLTDKIVHWHQRI